MGRETLIETIDELRNSLSNPKNLISEGVGKFDNLAKALMNNFQIKKGDKLYWMTEIEFYLFHDEHLDIITYPRRCDAGMWFFHASGVDITFASSFPNDSLESLKQHQEQQQKPKQQKPFLDKGATFGGILIRGIEAVDDKDWKVPGPIKVCDELFDKFNAFGELEGFPEIVPATPKARGVDPTVDTRYGRPIKDYAKKVQGILASNYRGINKDVFPESKLIERFKTYWDKGHYRFSAWS